MARPAAHSTSLVATVRRYFGFTQQALASFLAVSPAQLSRLESGQRTLSDGVYQHLLPLAALVPDALPPLSDAELLERGPSPATAPLMDRRADCLWRAALVRRELRGLVQQAHYAHRWRQALPALLAAFALPPTDSAAPPPADTPAGRAQFRTWYVPRWLQSHPTELSADEVARWHLLRLQAEALETEAAALTSLLDQ